MSPNDAHFIWSSLGRLLLAVALGAAVGFERETQRKPAGLRTIILITFGAALFTLLAEALPAIRGGEPFALAAHLIPGIGFLGAGAIIQSRGSVTGMTTAATIFAMAAVGMACGAGTSLLAVVATALLLIVLVILRLLEKRFERKPLKIAYSLATRQPDRCLEAVLDLARREQLRADDLRVLNSGTSPDDMTRLEFILETLEGSEATLIRQIETIRQTHA